jgi:hypothetical protein
MLAHMEMLRHLGQYLGLIYRDDGTWRIGRLRLRQLPGMKPPPPKNNDAS